MVKIEHKSLKYTKKSKKIRKTLIKKLNTIFMINFLKRILRLFKPIDFYDQNDIFYLILIDIRYLLLFTSWWSYIFLSFGYSNKLMYDLFNWNCFWFYLIYNIMNISNNIGFAKYIDDIRCFLNIHL